MPLSNMIRDIPRFLGQKHTSSCKILSTILLDFILIYYQSCVINPINNPYTQRLVLGHRTHKPLFPPLFLPLTDPFILDHCSARRRAILHPNKVSRQVRGHADLLFLERRDLRLFGSVFGRGGVEPVEVAG